MDSRDTARGRTASRVARVVLAAYLLALTLIAFWPVPVDSGAGGFLRGVTHAFPALTYARIEFGANIALFVPFGLLLALSMPRARYLVLPVAIVASTTIEVVQGLALDRRTASLLDVVANIAGACIGLLIVGLAEALSRKGHRAPFERGSVMGDGPA